MILASMIAAATLQAAVQTPTAAPQLGGQWDGVLSVGGQSLRIVLRVDAAGAAVVDSPDQGVNGIPAVGPTIEGGVVRFSIPAVRGAFEGALSGDGRTMTGVLTQGPAAMPLVLSRTADTASVAGPSRPQTPVAPFPYRSEDVTFPNASAGISLAGTLTLPAGNGPFPAAILITGSGAQDRDETIFDHKPFLIWADALTRRGVAVLRYDDRGVGGSGGGTPDDTTADFATDAAAALAWLRTRPEIDAGRIGLIGHSEGGVIAPLVAQNGGEPAWIVMLAGPSVSGGDILVEQQRRLATAAGLSPAQVENGNAMQRALMDAVARNKDDAAGAARETEAILVAAGQPQAQAHQAVRPIVSPWYRWFVAHDPAPALAGLHVPLLAIYGGKDLQVPADQNAPVLARVQPAAEVVVLPDLNHLMQTAETGAPAEYGTIEETVDPEALKTVVDWVAARSGLAATGPAYSLPYPASTAHRLIQGNEGPWGHTGHSAYAFDFQMPIGSDVAAAREGEVVAVQEAFADNTRVPGQENYVFIRHADGTFARYYHLTTDGALVEIGDPVVIGQVIARSGNSGTSAGPHLHFDVTTGCPEYGCQTVPIAFDNVSGNPLQAGRDY